MDILLWIAAGALAAVLLAGGAMKLAQPREKLAAAGFGFVEDIGTGTVKAIGALEVMAAAGLVLPAVVDTAPFLVPVAAVGVVLLMVGAVATHLRRHEPQYVVVPLVLLALGLLVAWGRFGPHSFHG